ncbi:Armadillo-like helical [Nannochloropsis gaditana]|uniref:Armadillo-like helical n=1 Tax=Nannochloropsis gaditana TaxID=72520 RepID=W7TXN6_9STRA|nr:Armadillo-like helical [Nannochloropsis gaditana]
MDFSSSLKAASCLVKRLRQETTGSELSTLLPVAQLLSSKLIAKPNFVLTDVDEPLRILMTLGQEARWECLCVALLVFNDAIAHTAPAPAVSPVLRNAVETVIALHLEHDEPRVRRLVAKTLGLLCTLPSVGTDAYTRFAGQLWASVDANITRRITETRRAKLGVTKNIVMDDVSGWRSLETSLMALREVVEACGPELIRRSLLTPEWLNKTVFTAAEHSNRYVREAAMDMARVVVDRCVCISDSASCGKVIDFNRLAAVVAGGLADAWPQVVYAAVIATRSLLLTATNHVGVDAEDLFAELLPPLCQCRYYTPEGVQVQAQETWTQLFAAANKRKDDAGSAGSGREAVARYVKEMVDCHCRALQHGRSHFTQVAACYALKELMEKIDEKVTSPFANQILRGILPCLRASHWELRSAGYVAFAQLSQKFPVIVMSRREDAVNVCFVGLEDESWSIREESAWALAAMTRYGEKTKMQQCLITRLEATLDAARRQPVETEEEQLRRFNDAQAHTGGPVFGCCGGLLHPRATPSGVNLQTDVDMSAYRYAAQPWEVSEGALYIFVELCSKDLLPQIDAVYGSTFADRYLPVLAELGGLRHFYSADRLRQSLWRMLPRVTERLGKPTLRRYLDLFTPALFSALASPAASPLTRHAAMVCIAELCRQMGPSFFVGRLSEAERQLYFRHVPRWSSPHGIARASRSDGGLIPSLLLSQPEVVSI